MPGLSFEEYVKRRGRLEGQFVLDEGNPWFVPVDALEAQARCRGSSLINFANYDYLDLARHPAIAAAVSAAVQRFGTGALGSRLVGGERTIHAEFEHAIAEFVGMPAGLATVSGNLTNVSVISHLLGSGDMIVVDELSHNSIFAGAHGNRAKLITFKHNDLDHLEYLLDRERQKSRNCLIAVEGLYSMDGDVPHLPRLLAIKDAHKAWLLVDEAHSIGVLGARGKGISEHFGEDPARIDLMIGTLSKALVTCGGFICGSKAAIELMKFTLPGFVYSVGLSPMIAAAASEALKLITSEPQRVARVQNLSELFFKKARGAGLDTGYAIGRGIIPVIIPELKQAMSAAKALLNSNIFAPPIIRVGLGKAGYRIRFFVSAAHQPQHIDAAVKILASQKGLQRADPVAAT
jgi:8-amino-7-oxononanoate synthase